MKNKILDWYFNTKKFTYGSRIYINSQNNKPYSILIGRQKVFRGKTFKEVLIKSTNNYFLKLLFSIIDFKLEPNSYHRNQFSGYKYKTNWKKIDDCLHLAWHVGGNEHKHITKVKLPEKLKQKYEINI